MDDIFPDMVIHHQVHYGISAHIIKYAEQSEAKYSVFYLFIVQGDAGWLCVFPLKIWYQFPTVSITIAMLEFKLIICILYNKLGHML